jgi:thioredoxin 1
MRTLSTLPSLFALFTAVSLLGAGCFGQKPPEMPTPVLNPGSTESMQIDTGESPENPDADMIEATSTAGATSTTQGIEEPKKDEPVSAKKATYVGFSRGAYDKALTEKGSSVLLFFYANWCPTCRVQEPQNLELFKDLDVNVQAFRVNFNDNETDDTEKELAKAFGVTYQHTFIFLDKNGKEITRKVGAVSPEELKNLLKEVANR